jgi:NarL family two-component system response regulator LiaR
MGSLTSVNTRAIAVEEEHHSSLLPSSPLTNRELEVLELIVAGCSNAEIASRCYITLDTVKTHVRNILDKLCVDCRTQAATIALRRGLVD